MAKKSSTPLVTWNSADLKNRKLTDQEVRCLQRIARQQQDPNYDYASNDQLTPDQLANMVRFRTVPPNVRLHREAESRSR
jgi:hypothetical protein